MTFAEALHRCFNGWATFSGRACKAEFWWFVLFVALTYVTLGAVVALSFPGAFGNALLTLFGLVVALPLAAAAFRRLQDTGRSGFLALTPVFGMVLASFGRLIGDPATEAAGILSQYGMVIVLAVWLRRDGERGPNAFGPDPRGRR